MQREREERMLAARLQVWVFLSASVPLSAVVQAIVWLWLQLPLVVCVLRQGKPRRTFALALLPVLMVVLLSLVFVIVKETARLSLLELPVMLWSLSLSVCLCLSLSPSLCLSVLLLSFHCLCLCLSSLFCTLVQCKLRLAVREITLSHNLYHPVCSCVIDLHTTLRFRYTHTHTYLCVHTRFDIAVVGHQQKVVH